MLNAETLIYTYPFVLGDRALKILVCMKQVPQKDAPLKLSEARTWIREDVSYEVNEPDAYALEEALRQKEKHSGEVVVITAGPARAQRVLREALAKGADRAIHLEDSVFVGLDAFNTARAFASAIKDEKLDLTFSGLQCDDYGYAQTGLMQSAIGENLQQIERLYVPQKTKNTEFLDGPPAEIAKKLAEKLRNEVRVL